MFKKTNHHKLGGGDSPRFAGKGQTYEGTVEGKPSPNVWRESRRTVSERHTCDDGAKGGGALKPLGKRRKKIKPYKLKKELYVL